MDFSSNLSYQFSVDYSVVLHKQAKMQACEYWPRHVWSYDKEEPVEKRKTIYPTLSKLEKNIRNLLENMQIDDYEKAKLLTQLQQRYKGVYSTRKPLKMHIETNAEVQPTKDNVIRKLDLSLTDGEDDDLVKIMPILTPVATDNVSSR